MYQHYKSTNKTCQKGYQSTMIFNLYIVVYEIMPLEIVSLFMSSLTLSSHFLLRDPLLLLPSIIIDSTLFIIYDYSLLRICSNHLNRPYLNFRFSMPLTTSFFIDTFEISPNKVLLHIIRVGKN